jgi:GMP synthase PP-ATPase subunit
LKTPRNVGSEKFNKSNWWKTTQIKLGQAEQRISGTEDKIKKILYSVTNKDKINK